MIRGQDAFRGSCFIIVGDNGFGFDPFADNDEYTMDHMNQLFAEMDIMCYSIRGNHDDPVYYDGTYTRSNFKLLKDYTKLNINGKEFLFVGGGISIDRTYRLEKAPDTYFEDEAFVLDESKADKCDVLITHSGPSWIGPTGKNNIKWWCKVDIPLWDELVAERILHDRLIELCKPSYHFCGHFHESANVLMDGCNSTILDELEIKEIVLEDRV